ncbi:SusC/RagA family TonB-linked outer membrane protein [Parapedobacter sp. DT-150]|uniref:SusC/RagA family TonB-linked outer membrane protein n=1 Tax=Parapedobacter sp. DT-150 TaxID=3396162 RepID=UPI003F1DB5D7
MNIKSFSFLLLLLVSVGFASGQSTIRVRVFDAESKQPISGASLKLSASERTVSSDGNGHFSLRVIGADTLVITHVGYVSQRIAVQGSMAVLDVYLTHEGYMLDAVEVSTGYYTVPKERATGSFVQVDSALLQRAIGGNILERLEGIAPGLQFVNPNGTSAADIRVRGLSTIESDETPLIVLDNFPYEGSIDNIDPNDIESINVLKDAAAASIWGARAGNGVIVITSKKARNDGKVRVAFNANTNITEKPDLFYSQEWLPSATVMEIEKARYELGHYSFADNVTNPYYVELLHALDEGTLDAEAFTAQEKVLRQTDTRQQALEYLYRKASFSQYALNINGGTERYGYNLTSGYHGTKGGLIGDEGRRLNLGMRNRFKPYDGMEINVGVAYVNQRNRNNGVDLQNLGQSNIGISPYLRLVDEDGNSLAVTKDLAFPYTAAAQENGLLDWGYRPVEEPHLSDRINGYKELRLNASVNAKIWQGLSAAFTYQYINGNNTSQSFYSKDSYYVRNLVNGFTQPDGSQIIPYNGILQIGSPTVSNIQQGRAQINYQNRWDGGHELTGLAGVEVRQSISDRFGGSILYNYDEEHMTGNGNYNFNQSYPKLPSGSGRIPDASVIRGRFTNRDLSYFSNASYTYRNRYIVSGSLRWDGSNLFGVKANQKGVPLWSIGGSWDISKENFYHLAAYVPYLRLRSTYGISGNVNKSVTHFPTIRYSSASTILNMATLTSVGNPSLRWEKVSTLNLGLDWRAFGNRVSGSVETYFKKGSDLIGDDYMDPTTGIIGEYKINYANIETQGWDVQVTTKNVTGQFNWTTTILSSWVRNKVTHFNTNEVTSISRFLTGSTPPPIVGASRDVVYTLPWHGLSPTDGLPIVFMDGEQTTEYSTYFSEYMDYTKLLTAGTSIPVNYGSIRNVFAWQGLELSALLTWKAGYVFRRASIGPFDDFNRIYHEDYFRRWQKPGDERITDVPAAIPIEQQTAQNTGAGSIYRNSAALITKGDHIRLQEVSLGYTMPYSLFRKLPFQSIRFSIYARNLGVVWKANKQGIDPDYSDATFPAPRSFSFGVQCNF